MLDRDRNTLDLSKIDLNLLIVLDALLEEHHVTRAAERVGLSQPAMSRSLGRLRKLLDDPLLVRAGQKQVLTPRGHALSAPLKKLLQGVGELMAPLASFDASVANRTFVIATGEYAQIVLAPTLLEIVRQAAPEVRIAFTPMGRQAGIEALAAGAVDLAIAPRIPLPSGLFRQALFRDPYVCMTKAVHDERAPDRTLSLSRYVELEHVVVAPNGGRTTAVDQALARVGLERRIVTWTSYFGVAHLLAQRHGVVATIQSRIAQALRGRGDISFFALLIALSPFVPHQIWHERAHKDAANRWLREMVSTAARATSPLAVGAGAD